MMEPEFLNLKSTSQYRKRTTKYLKLDKCICKICITLQDKKKKQTFLVKLRLVNYFQITFFNDVVTNIPESSRSFS